MYRHPAAPPKLTAAQSSSADDYRSVIDDLTVEIQKLKDELKRYKQQGPNMLKKEKLFEIKFHGLPQRRRLELETALRDFTAELESSQDTTSSRRKKSSRTTRDHKYSGSGSMSKHASSSSGSNMRPVDSAYASMSTGANSSGASLNRPSTSSRAKSSEQKVENYLRDIPEGLYPRHFAMTEKDKKRVVVRRLEQIFTGKVSGHTPNTDPRIPAVNNMASTPIVATAQVPQQPPQTALHVPPSLASSEPAREAKMLQAEQQPNRLAKKSHSRDNGSASQSNGDLTESGGLGGSNGSSGPGLNPSPPTPDQTEQRPTRARDLDPDRVQVPSENMEYIRHLGLVPPEIFTGSGKDPHDVHPDADGWVYLNLLCNLAQLHIINVTPDFVRMAVADMSTKFQLSPDGRKIRWRGGTEGTRFSSDSSGDNSQGSPQADDSDGSDQDNPRKKRKSAHGGSSKHASKHGTLDSVQTGSFHYKPLFARQESSFEQTSTADGFSSSGPVDDSNGGSPWDQSGSGTSPRRKRRRDGAVIYYSGAPFCTDLSGDPGDVSPTTYMLSSGQIQRDSSAEFIRPAPRRTESGSSLIYRPLSEAIDFSSRMEVDTEDSDEEPKLVNGAEDAQDDDLAEMNMNTEWTDEQQYMELGPLEPCGLGGVLPEDHFMVVVTTKRPKLQPTSSASVAASRAGQDATGSIIRRLASRSVGSQSSTQGRSLVEIEYVSGRIKRLAPVSLPPPALFYPPFSAGSSSYMDEDSGYDDTSECPKSSVISRRANLHRSDGYPDGVDLTSGDEDGEDPEDERDARPMYERREGGSSEHVLPSRRRQSHQPSFSSADAARGTSKSASADIFGRADGSSVATAGGVASGYTSSDEAS